MFLIFEVYVYGILKNLGFKSKSTTDDFTRSVNLEFVKLRRCEKRSRQNEELGEIFNTELRTATTVFYVKGN